jgi:hypothetical protein
MHAGVSSEGHRLVGGERPNEQYLGNLAHVANAAGRILRPICRPADNLPVLMLST